LLNSAVPCEAVGGSCPIAPGTAHNIIIAANGPNATGIEISDLDVDANHDCLQGSDTTQSCVRGTNPLLDLVGIQLRTVDGNHWIHNVTVRHVSGEMSEQFPVWIYGDGQGYD